jgi:hypothetical protein
MLTLAMLHCQKMFLGGFKKKLFSFISISAQKAIPETH